MLGGLASWLLDLVHLGEGVGARRGVFAVPSVVCGGIDPRWGHEGPAAGEILRLGLRPASAPTK